MTRMPFGRVASCISRVFRGAPGVELAPDMGRKVLGTILAQVVPAEAAVLCKRCTTASDRPFDFNDIAGFFRKLSNGLFVVSRLFMIGLLYVATPAKVSVAVWATASAQEACHLGRFRVRSAKWEYSSGSSPLHAAVCSSSMWVRAVRLFLFGTGRAGTV